MVIKRNNFRTKLFKALQVCFNYVAVTDEKTDLSSRNDCDLVGVINAAVARDCAFKTPLTMMWKLTSHCNLRCRHCFFHGKPDFLNSSKDLSKQEILKFARYCVEELNIVSVMISGGEPFMSEAIFDLLEYLTENNIYIVVQTNGTLIDADTVEKLKRILKPQITRFEISLEGVSPKTNDYIRGLGSFEKTMYAIHQLVSMNIVVCLNTTLTTANIKEVPYICEFCKNNNIKELNIGKFEDIADDTHYLAPPLEDSFIAIAEVIKAAKKSKIAFNPVFLSFPDILKFPEGRKIVDERLAEYYKNSDEDVNVCCLCHRHDRFLILSDGSITFCPGLDNVADCIGNIRNSHFKDIWNNRFKYPIFQNRDPQSFICGKCKYLVFCQAGCFAKAFKKFGSINAPDANCSYYKELSNL